jgi:hypothetical protein
VSGFHSIPSAASAACASLCLPLALFGSVINTFWKYTSLVLYQCNGQIAVKIYQRTAIINQIFPVGLRCFEDVVELSKHLSIWIG